jgi:hypothetical protein
VLLRNIKQCCKIGRHVIKKMFKVSWDLNSSWGGGGQYWFSVGHKDRKVCFIIPFLFLNFNLEYETGRRLPRQ